MFRFQNAGSQHMTRRATAVKALFGVLLLAIGSISLSGCGKKGPLYLPEKPQEVTEESSTTETATDNAADVAPDTEPTEQSTKPTQETP